MIMHASALALAFGLVLDSAGSAARERFVRVVGRRTAQIDPAAVAALLRRAEQIRFFDLRDAYHVIQNPDGTTTIVTDQPTKLVTITVNGRTKRVEKLFRRTRLAG